jgi:hypothetical protein
MQGNGRASVPVCAKPLLQASVIPGLRALTAIAEVGRELVVWVALKTHERAAARRVGVLPPRAERLRAVWCGSGSSRAGHGDVHPTADRARSARPGWLRSARLAENAAHTRGDSVTGGEPDTDVPRRHEAWGAAQRSQQQQRCCGQPGAAQPHGDYLASEPAGDGVGTIGAQVRQMSHLPGQNRAARSCEAQQTLSRGAAVVPPAAYRRPPPPGPEILKYYRLKPHLGAWAGHGILGRAPVASQSQSRSSYQQPHCGGS